MHRAHTARLDEVLASTLANAGADRLAAFERLRLAWPAACGPVVARHAVPLEYREGLLHVGVSNLHWREAVFQANATLTRRLRQVCPELRRLHLVHVPIQSTAPPPAPPPAPEVPDDVRAAHIENPDARRAWSRLLHARDHRED